MTSQPNSIQRTKQMHNRTVGQWGEDLAAGYLAEHGYLILERNARMAAGELDIVAMKDILLVFVEVKTRTRAVNGFPEEGLTPKKVEHLLNSAQEYLEIHPEYPTEWKIEVVTVIGRPEKYQIDLFDEVSYGD